MKQYEYEIELKVLYGKAIKDKDLRLAFDILRAGQLLGSEDMSFSRKEAEKENEND